MALVDRSVADSESVRVCDLVSGHIFETKTQVGRSWSMRCAGLVELSRHLVRLRTGEDGWRICPASLTARVPGKLTLTV